MCNNLNADGVINDVDNTGLIRFTQEANWHEEKEIQAVKKQFVSQKSNFGEILVNKLHTKKYWIISVQRNLLNQKNKVSSTIIISIQERFSMQRL